MSNRLKSLNELSKSIQKEGVVCVKPHDLHTFLRLKEVQHWLCDGIEAAKSTQDFNAAADVPFALDELFSEMFGDTEKCLIMSGVLLWIFTEYVEHHTSDDRANADIVLVVDKKSVEKSLIKEAAEELKDATIN